MANSGSYPLGQLSFVLFASPLDSIEILGSHSLCGLQDEDGCSTCYRARLIGCGSAILTLIVQLFA
jgi:hypothetical protein